MTFIGVFIWIWNCEHYFMYPFMSHQNLRWDLTTPSKQHYSLSLRCMIDCYNPFFLLFYFLCWLGCWNLEVIEHSWMPKPLSHELKFHVAGESEEQSLTGTSTQKAFLVENAAVLLYYSTSPHLCHQKVQL